MTMKNPPHRSFGAARLHRGAEIQPQPQRCVGGDAPTVVDDFGIPLGEMPTAFARPLRERRYSARNSSFSISPGVTRANPTPP